MITNYLASITVDQFAYAVVYCGLAAIIPLWAGPLLRKPWLAYVGLALSTAFLGGLWILVQYAG